MPLPCGFQMITDWSLAIESKTVSLKGKACITKNVLPQLDYEVPPTVKHTQSSKRLKCEKNIVLDLVKLQLTRN
jgi:hypothetical protein